jgi:hypothetical protein
MGWAKSDSHSKRVGANLFFIKLYEQTIEPQPMRIAGTDDEVTTKII